MKAFFLSALVCAAAVSSAADLTLSIDTRLQHAVMEAMGDYSGSVVVMDPDSGKLLDVILQQSAQLSKSQEQLSKSQEQIDRLISIIEKK